MVVFLLGTGAILFSLGVIAEYIGVSVNMAMGKPPYLIVSDPADGPFGRVAGAPRGRRRLPVARPVGAGRSRPRPSRRPARRAGEPPPGWSAPVACSGRALVRELTARGVPVVTRDGALVRRDRHPERAGRRASRGSGRPPGTDRGGSPGAPAPASPAPPPRCSTRRCETLRDFLDHVARGPGAGGQRAVPGVLGGRRLRRCRPGAVHRDRRRVGDLAVRHRQAAVPSRSPGTSPPPAGSGC